MKQKNGISIPAVGAGSLLTTFAVLCMTVFALLCIATVQEEKRQEKATDEAVAAYYAADFQAEQIFARLRRGEQVEDVVQQDNIFIYQCPISEQQELLVILEQTDSEWKVLRWQAVAREDTGEDVTLPVWNGEGSLEEKP
ncbi:MAG: hypothetical protein IJN20_06800 [Oscillospiraceae bacterium]|nr:hypothetical protein [Oscillospiraceae bacterium]